MNDVAKVPVGAVGDESSRPADGAPNGGGASDVEPHIPYDDLRGWIDEARKLGEVRDVAGAT